MPKSLILSVVSGPPGVGSLLVSSKLSSAILGVLFVLETRSIDEDEATDIFGTMSIFAAGAKGLISPGASRIRGRPRFLFTGSPRPPRPSMPKGRILGIIILCSILGFLACMKVGLVESVTDEDDDGMLVTLAGVDVGMRQVPLDPASVVETSAKPLTLRFSAVLSSEANCP